ncbi:MAG: TrmH family RNA methyltransferase [Sphaerochaetaceae bacterium]
MITIRKLRSLPEDTRMRKVIRLLESNRQQTPLERSYLIELCLLVTESNEKRVGDFTRRCSENLISCLKEDREYEFALDDLRYSLASDFNMTSGDWDFVDDTAKLDPSGRAIRPFSVLLDRIRSPFNVGSIFRTSDSFGVKEILLTPLCADVNHSRTKRSAAGCLDSVPYRILEETSILSKLEGREVFALELGGKSVDTFEFPEDGVMIVGSEELGVSPALLEYAKHSAGIVSIPLFGSKGSLNVSTAFSIAMYWWMHTKGKTDQL